MRPERPPPPNPPRKLAIITTVWQYLSHAQHEGDRFLVGYPLEGKWHRPALEVAALYVDQKPASIRVPSERVKAGLDQTALSGTAIRRLEI